MNQSILSPIFKPRLLALLSLAGLLGLSGCASVTARSIVTDPLPGSRPAPERIYVANFAAPAENLRVDRSGAKLVEFQQQISAKLATSLADQLDRSLLPTKILTGSFPPRSNAWLIVGRFDRIEQGSRALRATIGFGLGGTKMVTTAMVYDLSTPVPTPIMSIETYGGSNAAPGTVVNLAGLVSIGPAGIGTVAVAATTSAITGYGGVALGAGTSALPGLTDDVRRTAREITAVLSTYAYEQRWIPENQVLTPKPANSGQLRLGDPKRPNADDEAGES